MGNWIGMARWRTGRRGVRDRSVGGYGGLVGRRIGRRGGMVCKDPAVGDGGGSLG